MRVRLPRVTAGRLGNQTKGLFGNLIIAILAVCITAGVYIYFHNRKPYNQPNAVYHPNSIQQEVKDSDQKGRISLGRKDYSTYQDLEAASAQQLIIGKDYSGAKTLLDNIIDNVPSDKIISPTYMAYINLAKAEGNKQLQVKYEQLLIPILQKEGDTKSAAIYQQELDNLK